ncbi:rRNA-processing protein efg1 [Penicillium taxi]|uniref:rRNA-processing protein efg1 n=1 Tax=Penicillium taxi TaxID=168475 RepID=UPI00254570AB|nr:rRNA-processing protein efg1 [Penicillium taxi]KAJ5888235.1 rRNA-processing protein efg1 [Penicillium taxi]
MSDDRTRSASSKRKNRDGPEDTASRKKPHRNAAGSHDDGQYEEYGNAGTSKSSYKHKGKPTPRDEKDENFTSVNDLKKRIRDVTRLLAKGKLPADARVVQERALEGYQRDLAEETARRERSQKIKKYHFVRFLDRKTASKQLKLFIRQEKEKDLDSDQTSHLQQKIHAARVNLNYTVYYPLTEKYISLYPKSQEKADNKAGKESESAQTPDKTDVKPPLWSVVEKCMKEGTLDQLREGKLNIGPDGQPIPDTIKKISPEHDSKKQKKKQGPKETKQSFKARDDKGSRSSEKQIRKDYGKERDRLHDVAPVVLADDESDGGFFDE